MEPTPMESTGRIVSMNFEPFYKRQLWQKYQRRLHLEHYGHTAYTNPVIMRLFALLKSARCLLSDIEPYSGWRCLEKAERRYLLIEVTYVNFGAVIFARKDGKYTVRAYE